MFRRSMPIVQKRRLAALALSGAIAILLPPLAAQAAGVSAGGDVQITSAAKPATDESIRPFQFHASDAALADLKQRIAATKWPDRELVADGTQGVRLEDRKSVV